MPCGLAQASGKMGTDGRQSMILEASVGECSSEQQPQTAARDASSDGRNFHWGFLLTPQATLTLS